MESLIGNKTMYNKRQSRLYKNVYRLQKTNRWKRIFLYYSAILFQFCYVGLRRSLKRTEKTSKSEVITTIKKCRVEYLGHSMKNEQGYGLFKLIVQVKVYGNRGPGRIWISWLQNLRKWHVTKAGLFRTVPNNVKIVLLFVKIRNE